MRLTGDTTGIIKTDGARKTLLMLFAFVLIFSQGICGAFAATAYPGGVIPPVGGLVGGAPVGAPPAPPPQGPGGTDPNNGLFAAPGNANFNTIGVNIVDSVALLPGLLSGLAYLLGLLLGARGILKIKEHVENPHQLPLKDGAMGMLAGGGLFALPIIFSAMHTTIGADAATVQAAHLMVVGMNVH